MIYSMTAFASRAGVVGANSWTLELRGVNARGLDLRMRMPEGMEPVEATARKGLTEALQRGNITLNLRVIREESGQSMSLDLSVLDATLKALDTVQDRAFEMGVTLAQPNAADVLAQRGVVIHGKSEDDTEALVTALQAAIPALIGDFVAMRAQEGASLVQVIIAQLDQIDDLIGRAQIAADARRPVMEATLTTALRRVLEDAIDIDAARVAQELALLAVKADVTEEIDRLKGHVAAARSLLSAGKPAGRKLDFLAQEFNREANTLCSKAGAAALTAVGLDLKAVIEQMREQIQNVE